MTLCLCVTIAYAQTTPVKSIGDPAPSLSISKWLKGESISEFKKGQIYVVEFWATWCKPCIAGMPHLSELAQKYKKDVTVIGVDVYEKSETSLSVIESFVAGMGNKMNYHVAVEKDKLMAQDWLSAYHMRGIPAAFVIDRSGRIAWIGMPVNLDKVLPQVIAGKWDLVKAASDRNENARLTQIDNNLVVTTLNPFMGNPGRPEEALKKIDELLVENPGLKYYYKTAHFTIFALVKLNDERVVDYCRVLFEATDDPPFKSVTDAVINRPNLKPAIYLLAVEAYQQQLDRYPWSMNFPETYKSMAKLYSQAGNEAKAAEYLKKAETYKPVVN